MKTRIKNPVLGVPISWLDKYDPEQIEILGTLRPVINGESKYQRILIRRVDDKNEER